MTDHNSTLECPFCGAEPAFHANDWCDPPEWSVYCPQCLARSAGNVHQDAAVAAWNRRPSRETPAVVEAVAGAIVKALMDEDSEEDPLSVARAAIEAYHKATKP